MESPLNSSDAECSAAPSPTFSWGFFVLPVGRGGPGRAKLRGCADPGKTRCPPVAKSCPPAPAGRYARRRSRINSFLLKVCAAQGHIPAALYTVYSFFPRCQRCGLHELAFLWNFACMRTVDKPSRGDYNNRDFGYERWRLCSRNRHRLFYSPGLSAVHAQTCAKCGGPAGKRPPGSAICIP